MEKKPLDIEELRQQRERIRRITVGALVAAMVGILASCQGLVARETQSPPQAAPSQITVQGAPGAVGAAQRGHRAAAARQPA